MPDLPEQPHPDEHLLLMYIVGELPHADRVMVDARLAVEDDLRAKLESLRATYDAAFSALATSDSTTPLAVSEPVAVRRVGRAMAQWHADRAAAKPAAPARTGLRYPWWVYPSASAAALLFAFLAWWGQHPSTIADRNDAPTTSETPYSAPGPYFPQGPYANQGPYTQAPSPDSPAPTESELAELSPEDATLAADSLAPAHDHDSAIARLEHLQSEALSLDNLTDPILPSPDETN